MSTSLSTVSEQSPPGGTLRLLEPGGCLSLEAMCFVDELDADQQLVVHRHVQSCPSCAQQQAALSRAAERMRRARPQIAVPLEARVLARQAMMRGLQDLPARTELVDPTFDKTAQIPRKRRRTSPSRWRWPWALAFSGAVLLLLGLLLLLLRH